MKNQGIEEDLMKATSKMIADLVTSHNANVNDIDSGIYRPLGGVANLIDIEKLFLEQNEPINTKTKDKWK
jgi:hypothetical protein